MKNRRSKATRSLFDIANLSPALEVEFSQQQNLTTPYMKTGEQSKHLQSGAGDWRDGIVAADIAALTNIFFLHRGKCSAVIELFPPHFLGTFVT
jgi:hypothetical protein